MVVLIGGATHEVLTIALPTPYQLLPMSYYGRICPGFGRAVGSV